MASFLKNLFEDEQASKAERVVGIDIGSTSIKVVELENKDHTLNLTTYGEILVGPYADAELGENVTLSAKQEQTALIDILREASVKAHDAVFTVPLSSSFVTVMTLPEPNSSVDISQRVSLEARKYIPIPMNEVTLDWAEITGYKKDKKQEGRDILLVAIQNDVLTRINTLMKYTNLPGQTTEIECFSAIRSNFDLNNEDIITIVDCGGASTKIYIVRDGLLNQIHRIRSGGVHITNQIADDIKIDFADAENRKREYVGQSDEVGYVIRRIHEKNLNRIFTEVKQVMNHYESENEQKIQKMILIGGVTGYPHITDFVSGIIDCKVEISTSFEKVKYPAFIEDVVNDIGPVFTTALGAAMRYFE